ncbi:hypothetical protein [Rhizobium mesoamericanum]|uniref:hypothetical protein n=1 Tax=Rhizobium mesoamericanum TaxID=1079800 RepID=UPI0027D88D90|nr:hypothetical protein [Rhizobium mesoamericanum]
MADVPGIRSGRRRSDQGRQGYDRRNWQGAPGGNLDEAFANKAIEKVSTRL